MADETVHRWSPPARLDVRLETPRLIVRTYTLEDVPAVFAAIQASRPELLPWMPWARDGHAHPAGTAKYVAEQILASINPAAAEHVGVGIFERDGGAYVGASGYHDVHRDTASAETGYWIRSDRHRRGYCTEAMRHVLSWLLRPQAEGGVGLRRVRLFCSSANIASQRVLEKLGLPREVAQRDECYVETIGLTDRLGWGVLAKEWDTVEHRMR